MTIASPSRPRIAFVGLCTLDVVQLVREYPGANEKVRAVRFASAAGGPATNAAVAAVHCGGEAVLVTRVPRHPLSAGILDDLAACGVEVVNVSEDDGLPVVASIVVSETTGDRSVVSAGDGARAYDLDAAERGAAAVDGGVLAAVLVDGYNADVAVPVMRAARRAGVPVVLDGGSVKDHTEQLLGLVDVAVVSADFHPAGVERTPGAVLAYLAERGVRYAAVTRGDAPLVYAVDGVVGEVAPPRVEVVDTLGAGDFFHGALTYELAVHGLTPDGFVDALGRASVVAARSVQSFGTRGWLR